MNLEFDFEEAPVTFHVEELDSRSRAIHERAVSRAKKYLVAEDDLLESIIEVDQHKIYEKFGLHFLTTYCVKHLRLDENVAGVLVRVARKSQVVPELREALAQGEVSISNAKTIASVITNKNQAEWIEKAKTLSKSKLEREVAIVSPAKPIKTKYIGNGRVQVVIEMSEEEYARRCRVKDLVSQSLGRNATDSETELAMMECYEFHKNPVRKAERAAARKSKEMDASWDVSAADAAKGVTVESKADSKSKPDSKSSIPAHVKHAVYLRDKGHCQARNPDGSKCCETRWVQLHHIVEKSRGGLDVPENLITLCSAHHRLWHKRKRGMYTLSDVHRPYGVTPNRREGVTVFRPLQVSVENAQSIA